MIASCSWEIGLLQEEVDGLVSALTEARNPAVATLLRDLERKYLEQISVIASGGAPQKDQRLVSERQASEVGKGTDWKWG